ncbi:hypothetical protein J2S00_003322 [Caldalkalibacillus uzonensis]|uniref:YtkA-like domain-containing protein n=1 Tax=Caldalkalibacillus uzonensis TaxID=353224 RepID=A0ABU0CVQ7_9BACI|nr:FixH family protein [Caldalkalibacillus uzonensis]MDQ0340507.1 hypothetical protein [Caldalkalibacillus uzonensis]
MKRIWHFERKFKVKKLAIAFLLLIATLLTACQSDDSHHGHESDDLAMPQAPIEVTFYTEPEVDIKAGEAVYLIAEVTQEGQAVTDAELVRFEIWSAEEEQKEIGERDHRGDEAEHHALEEDSQEHHTGHQAMDDYETEHEMIEAGHRGDGQYVLEYTFEKAGTYNVMYHVDARGFHAMTKHEVMVGE